MWATNSKGKGWPTFHLSTCGPLAVLNSYSFIFIYHHFLFIYLFIIFIYLFIHLFIYSFIYLFIFGGEGIGLINLSVELPGKDLLFDSLFGSV